MPRKHSRPLFRSNPPTRNNTIIPPSIERLVSRQQTPPDTMSRPTKDVPVNPNNPRVFFDVAIGSENGMCSLAGALACAFCS